MRKKIKAIMGRMHQENLELDEPAERFFIITEDLNRKRLPWRRGLCS